MRYRQRDAPPRLSPGWSFAIGTVGISLDERQRLFLNTLIAMLDRVRPRQVDPPETALQHHPDMLVTFIPHRGMAGLSIVTQLDLGRPG
jgi:hypothetical protein